MGRRLLALVSLIGGFAFVGIAPASAGTVQVAGEQLAPGPECSGATFSMAGGLIGCWYVDTFVVRQVQPSGTIQATGTEHFVGCLDLDADQMCGAGDPTGTLSFSFKFSGKLDLDTVNFPEIRGRCQHPVVSGTPDFAGASGVLTFQDNVVMGTADGTAAYRGHISL